MPDGTPVDVVWTPLLVDGEKQADIVGRQFREAGVDAVICAPDTWAFPQLTLMSLLAHLPADMPVNITCGNSGPKPGVVYAHAVNGALAQSGRLAHLNVGTWPDTGDDPKPTERTAAALVDWCYAALTCVGLQGRRVVVFGHDSMGMETALAHVIAHAADVRPGDHPPGHEAPGRHAQQGRLRQATKLARLRAGSTSTSASGWTSASPAGEEKFDQSLAMYLIVRDLMADLNAVGGGFMSQLEWGSDLRGMPLPVADVMESLFNSTFDHNGQQAAPALRHRGRRAGPADDALQHLALRRQSAAVHGLPQGLGAVGDPGPGPQARHVPFTGDDLWAQQGHRRRRQQRLGQLRLGRPAGRPGREDHGGRLHAAGRTVLLPRRRQQRDLHHARRHRRHRRPPGLQRA